jgi:hypothetical protein
MEMNSKNIITAVIVLVVVVVGFLYLTGSGGDEEVEAPATETGN